MMMMMMFSYITFRFARNILFISVGYSHTGYTKPRYSHTGYIKIGYSHKSSGNPPSVTHWLRLDRFFLTGLGRCDELQISSKYGRRRKKSEKCDLKIYDMTFAPLYSSANSIFSFTGDF